MNFTNLSEKEMHAKKNRVRNIIGDSHWGEEGKYKEILLTDLPTSN